MDFINIIVLIWLLVIILIFFQELKREEINYDYKKEGFTSKIKSFCNPHLRNIRIFTESFINNDNYFIKKLKNIGIY
jgi:hypothetical protein